MNKVGNANLEAEPLCLQEGHMTEFYNNYYFKDVAMLYRQDMKDFVAPSDALSCLPSSASDLIPSSIDSMLLAIHVENEIMESNSLPRKAAASSANPVHYFSTLIPNLEATESSIVPTQDFECASQPDSPQSSSTSVTEVDDEFSQKGLIQHQTQRKLTIGRLLARSASVRSNEAPKRKKRAKVQPKAPEAPNLDSPSQKSFKKTGLNQQKKRISKSSESIFDPGFPTKSESVGRLWTDTGLMMGGDTTPNFSTHFSSGTPTHTSMPTPPGNLNWEFVLEDPSQSQPQL